MDDKGKNEYLGAAKAMLFPARTGEAFGMVMVEAMACGTPVLAYNIAAMPEVVSNGITGYIVSDKEEMILKLIDISSINRSQCAKSAMALFDVKVIAKKYLELF